MLGTSCEPMAISNALFPPDPSVCAFRVPMGAGFHGRSWARFRLFLLSGRAKAIPYGCQGRGTHGPNPIRCGMGELKASVNSGFERSALRRQRRSNCGVGKARREKWCCFRRAQQLQPRHVGYAT